MNLAGLCIIVSDSIKRLKIILNCLVQIGFDNREKEFQKRLMEESKALTKELNARFNAPRLDMRRPRPKPMVTKPVKYTWSRRAWKSKT
jgi:hypothetical protein